MSVEQFLSEYSPGDEPSESTLAELSGIDNAEAEDLARKWLAWTNEEVLDLHTHLSDLSEVDTTMEFETVFKMGLKHRHGPVRAVATHALAETGDTSAVARILDLYNDDDDVDVRTAAATAIGSFAAVAAEGRFSERIRRLIINSLDAVLRDGEAPSELWRRSLEAAGGFSNPKFGRYIERAAASPAPEFRRSVLIAIARTSDPRWLDHVTKELESDDSSVRFEAANALGEIGDEPDAFFLEEALDDQDLMVQLAGVAAAEKIAGPTAKDLLRRAAQSPEPSVATAATAALVTIENDDQLVMTVTPQMASEGMFGGATGAPDADRVPYDAAEREGWGALDEEGQQFHAADNFREFDDDPEAPLLDYEATPGQFEDDD